MAFADLQPNQMVDEANASTGGFTAIGAKNPANQCYTKSQALTAYNLDAVSMGSYANNQLVPKSVWITGVVPPLPVGTFDNNVEEFAVQADGKVLIGGRFTVYNSLSRLYLIRLNDNGSEDTAFYTNIGSGLNNYVHAIAVQSDGKILVGGRFTTFRGATRNRLIRLNADGTEDTAFYTNLGAGFNNQISTLAVQADGKILAGGNFTTFKGVTRNYLVRLNSDGTEDTAFYTNLGSGFDSFVNVVALTSTNFEIYVGGRFVTVNGTAKNRFARLLGNGQNDVSFNFNLGNSADNEVYGISVQSDNSAVIVGGFTNFIGSTAYHVAKVNNDGTLNTAFRANVNGYFALSGDDLNSVCTMTDGRIVIAGTMSIQHVDTVKRIMCLNADGTKNTAFMTNLGSGYDGVIWAVFANPNGKVLVGGSFLAFNGNSRVRYSVLKNNGTDAMI
jgi:uncharacterized delta-60 repeat protein